MLVWRRIGSSISWVCAPFTPREDYGVAILAKLFAVVLVTPIGIDNIGWKFYIIWAILNATFVPIVYLFYPETSNRRLEDLDRYFARGQHVVVCFDKEATSSKRPERFVVQDEEAKMAQGARLSGDFLEKTKQDSVYVN